MKRTDDLRFVKRSVPAPEFGPNVGRYQMILQQKWVNEPELIEVSDGDYELEEPYHEEWRDVPVCEENEQ